MFKDVSARTAIFFNWLNRKLVTTELTATWGLVGTISYPMYAHEMIIFG